ncbi:MAG: DUF2147 domain-containing protein [Chitinophagaceae bacterium]
MNEASKIAMISLMLFFHAPLSNAQTRNDIVGTWMSSQRNVMVKIYTDSSFFKGKVIWFDDSDNKSLPMNVRKDIKNPNKNLRLRKIIGIDVLRGLRYNAKCKCWQDGKIYDVQTGRTWNASITLENINKVKVRGFWHYEFIGKSMIFRRVRG